VSNVSRDSLSNLRGSSNDTSSHDSSHTSSFSCFNNNSLVRNKTSSEIRTTVNNDSKSTAAMKVHLNDSINGEVKKSCNSYNDSKQRKSSYSCSSGATNNTSNGHRISPSLPAIKIDGSSYSSPLRPSSRSSSRAVSPAVTRQDYERLKSEFDRLHKEYLLLTTDIEPVTRKFNRLEAQLNNCNEGSSEWNVRHIFYISLPSINPFLSLTRHRILLTIDRSCLSCLCPWVVSLFVDHFPFFTPVDG
jgi:hypothetical protein